MFTLTFDIDGMSAQAHNTGNGYTLLGQVVYTARLPSGTILLCDVCRGLDYVYPESVNNFEGALESYKRNGPRGYVTPEDQEALPKLYAAFKAHLFEHCENALRNLPT